MKIFGYFLVSVFLNFTTQTFAQNNQPGVMLQGKPSDIAIDHLILKIEGSVSASMISKDGLLRTRLDAAISPNATVQQVNDALKSVGASITTMVPGAFMVSIAIPVVADVNQAKNIGKKLVNSGAFILADPAYALTP